jgi:hypothetical protein
LSMRVSDCAIRLGSFMAACFSACRRTRRARYPTRQRPGDWRWRTAPIPRRRIGQRSGGLISSSSATFMAHLHAASSTNTAPPSRNAHQ